MISKKILISTGVLATAFATVIASLSFRNASSFIKAATEEKTFVFDESVASQVQYQGNESQYSSNVTTGKSTPINVKLYREAGENKEYAGNSGCFFSADYSNERTFAFEAGLNNLIGFEIQFKYDYNAKYDSGDYSHFNYNVTMTFYSKNAVVDTANYSLSETVRNTIYTHTWSKGIEISEKIDRVKCSLANGGGSSRTDWRVLKINYFKVVWDC